jgi:hypothetical protein
VLQADLASLARNWVLRAWFILTVLVALVAMLDQGNSERFGTKPGAAVLAALFQADENESGAPETLRELLKLYVVIWVSFVIVLTAGTISSELGVVADAVLSRGISRWQYFLAKWTARLTAVLAVYIFVVLPTAIVLWLGTPAKSAVNETVGPAELTLTEANGPPGSLISSRGITLVGLAFGLGQVAAILAFVVTCGVACSASFENTVISIGVGWVSIYGTGLVLSMLDITPFSPGRLIRNLPDILMGRYVAVDQFWLLGGWVGAALVVAILTGIHFSARDL